MFASRHARSAGPIGAVRRVDLAEIRMVSSPRLGVGGVDGISVSFLIDFHM